MNSISLFCKGYAIKEKNGCKGVIDINGKEILPCDYDYCNIVHGDYIQLGLNKKCGISDICGNIIAPCIYDSPIEYNEDNLAIIIYNGYEGLINQHIILLSANYQKIIIDRRFIIATKLDDSDNKITGIFKYNKGTKQLNLILPFKYTKIEKMSDGLFLAYEANTKSYVYINELMHIEINLKNKYDIAFSFHNGLAQVFKDDKGGYINHNGDEVIHCQFSICNMFTENGLADVYKDNKYAVIDKSNRIIIPYNDRRYCVPIDGTNYIKEYQVFNEEGLLDIKGNEILPCIYKHIELDTQHIAICSKFNNDCIFINLDDFKNQINMKCDKYIIDYKNQSITKINKSADESYELNSVLKIYYNHNKSNVFIQIYYMSSSKYNLITYSLNKALDLIYKYYFTTNNIKLYYAFISVLNKYIK